MIDDIVIVTCPHKKVITTDFLDKEELHYKVSVTPDVDVNHEFINKDFLKYNQNLTGAYRCHYGHKQAISFADFDNTTLVFEDDAVPILNNWWDIANDISYLTKEFDIVFLHLRQALILESFTYNDKYEITTKIAERNGVQWGLGTLAYLIGPLGKEKILNHNYNGLPLDLLYTNQFNYCWLSSHDLFAHERLYGSIVENAN